eukprot:6211988-Lingulodinium_polyedra.AAC.1
MQASPGRARQPVTNTMHQRCAVVRIDQRPGQARRTQPGQARTAVHTGRPSHSVGSFTPAAA